MTYQVNEIFSSLQAEGVWTGVPATFIRLQGCTVGCPWCDSGPDADKIWGRQTNGLTRNTWRRGGTRMTIDEIMPLVADNHVVITGGEPTLYNLDKLILALRRLKPVFIQLETSGQQWLKGTYKPDWITWSPKESLHWTAPLNFYTDANEIKFVVDEALELRTVLHVAEAAYGMGNAPHMVMMPEGCPPTSVTIDKAIHFARALLRADIPRVRFSDRMQYRLGIR